MMAGQPSSLYAKKQNHFSYSHEEWYSIDN